MGKRAAGVSGVLAAIGIAASALAISGAAASPDASFVVNAGARPPAVTGAEREDALRYAEQEGLAAEDVVERVAGQNEFALLATDVQTRYPEQFSSARWDPGPDSRGEIAFVVLPPSGAVELIRASGQSVRVRVVGGASEQDAVAAQVRAFGAAHAVEGVREATASVDPAAATITITIEPDPAVGADQVDRLRADVAGAAEAAAADPSMQVEVVVAPCAPATDAGAARTARSGGRQARGRRLPSRLRTTSRRLSWREPPVSLV